MKFILITYFWLTPENYMDFETLNLPFPSLSDVQYFRFNLIIH